MEIKFLIMQGYVISSNDRDISYINEEDLIKLYGIKKEDCIILKKEPTEGYYCEPFNILLEPRERRDYEEHLIKKLIDLKCYIGVSGISKLIKHNRSLMTKLMAANYNKYH